MPAPWTPNPMPTPSPRLELREQIALIAEARAYLGAKSLNGTATSRRLIDRLATALSSLLPAPEGQTRLEEAERIIASCGRQFRSYEQQHRAKHTPDADAKAEVNETFALYCEAFASNPQKDRTG